MFNYYNRSKEECYVSIALYSQENNLVYFDFIDSNELDFFQISGDTNLLNIEGPTVIKIINYKGRRLSEGTIYCIQRETISEIHEKKLVERIEDSYLLGAQIDLSKWEKPFFGKSKSFSTFDLIERNSWFYGTEDIKTLPSIPQEIDELIVRYVGQGNWNEIYYNKNLILIYDIGAAINFSRSEIDSLVDMRSTGILRDKPILIISHWDLDHYHCLVALNSNLLRAFSYIVYPSFSPSLTSRKVLSRINYERKTNNISIEFESDRIDHPNPLTSFSKGKIIFYVGHKNRNRNTSGILIQAKGSMKTAILSGDHHYEQISKYILKDIVTDNHCLVVPHHGGNAGRFVYEKSLRRNSSEAIISVGLNHYGHPQESVIHNLRQTGFNVLQTNFRAADISINLD